MGKSQNQNERLRKIGNIKLEERDMSRVNQLTKPVTKIDISALKAMSLSRSIYERGVEIFYEGRVKRNTLYPWKYKVSGDSHEHGSSLYIVDIAAHSCSCMWFENTGTTCKHLVAALVSHVNAQPDLLSKV